MSLGCLCQGKYAISQGLDPASLKHVTDCLKLLAIGLHGNQAVPKGGGIQSAAASISEISAWPCSSLLRAHMACENVQACPLGHMLLRGACTITGMIATPYEEGTRESIVAVSLVFASAVAAHKSLYSSKALVEG